MVFALLLLWAIAAPMVASCTCAPYSVEQSFADADAVFTGRPREVQMKSHRPEGFYYLEVVFEVETAWKGLSENVAVLLTPFGDASCGYRPLQFDPQTRYLIYARNAERLTPHLLRVPAETLAGLLRPFGTGICVRNAVLEGPLLDSPRNMSGFFGPTTAQEDLEVLGTGTRMVPSGDVTRDGTVDVQDAILTLRAIAELISFSAEQKIVGDLNWNAAIEIGDAVLILRRAVGLM